MTAPAITRCRVEMTANDRRMATMTVLSTVRLLVLAALWATSMLVLEAVPASGQVTAERTYIAIPEVFPDIDARAMLIREPGFDVVVLRESEATTDALTMALLALEDARERNPAPTNGEIMPIMGFVVEKRPEGRARRVLERALARLERSEPTDLGSLGPGRRIRMPAR